MAEPVTSQFVVFLCTVLTGALAGLMYDVYAGTGQVLGLKKTGTLLGDVIYWLCATVVVYALLLQYNQGEVRFFVLLGLGAGAALYYRLSRRRVRILVVKIIRVLVWLVKWLITILLFPLRVIYIFLAFPFRITGLVLGKAGRLAVSPVKKLVPAPVKLLCRRWSKRWPGIAGKIWRKK